MGDRQRANILHSFADFWNGARSFDCAGMVSVFGRKTEGGEMITPESLAASGTEHGARYNTGKPCKRGHFSDRYVNSGICCQCATDKAKTPHSRELQKIYSASPIGKAKGKITVARYRSRAEIKARAAERELLSGIKIQRAAYRANPKNKVKRAIYNVEHKYDIDLVNPPSGSKPSVCEICGDNSKIHFDHCHQTKRFRGWLCRGCNHALGNVKDNPETLRKLARYLENVETRT
jgi:Recombination endonuclease VII